MSDQQEKKPIKVGDLVVFRGGSNIDPMRVVAVRGEELMLRDESPQSRCNIFWMMEKNLELSEETGNG